jgi:hypothetical protein
VPAGLGALLLGLLGLTEWRASRRTGSA